MAESMGATKQSGWGKVSESTEADEEASSQSGERMASAKRKAASIAKDVKGALTDSIGPAALGAARAVRTGALSVEKALVDPGSEGANEILAQADLPEVTGDNPLVRLALRLDREADLYRGVAMRQLARAGWMDRLAAIASVVALIGVVVLASIAAFRALFALGEAQSAVLLLAVGAILLVAGAFFVTRATARIRMGQAQAARDALMRADLAEARLHRIAAILTLRETDEDAYHATLRALEADMRASG